MNKIIYHRFLNREVVIMRDLNKNIIGYVLISVTPNYKRALYSTHTRDRKEVKKFLNLI